MAVGAARRAILRRSCRRLVVRSPPCNPTGCSAVYRHRDAGGDHNDSGAGLQLHNRAADEAGAMTKSINHGVSEQEWR
jgi:hypothetical protein